jgi:hypothetical protein
MPFVSGPEKQTLENITTMQSSNMPLHGVVTRDGTTAAQGKDVAARRRGASTRGARFATRGARTQAVLRMTPAERETFWAEEATRSGFTRIKFVQYKTASPALLIARGRGL